MNELELDSKTSPNALWAYRDARQRSINNASAYSDKLKVAAESLKICLEMVYGFKNIYLEYRKKFISIKLDNAYVKNRSQLAWLEEEWVSKGYVKVVTAQGVIYRIPKA